MKPTARRSLAGGTRPLRSAAEAEVGRGSGDSATIGIENALGSDAFQCSFNEPAVQSGFAILFTPP